MGEEKPIWLKLPCINCGSEIPQLIEGTTIKCFACGIENSFMESKEKLEKNALEVFGQIPSIELIEDVAMRTDARITRENKLGTMFSALEGEYQQKLGNIPVVSTPLEKYPIEKEDILEFANRYNIIANLIKNYVLPLALTETEAKNANQMYYFCLCRSMLITGTYHTILASHASNNTEAWN